MATEPRGLPRPRPRCGCGARARRSTPTSARTCSSFFDQTTLPPDVFAARRDRYREQLQAALGASEPLVKLNPALLRAVHDKAINEDTSLVFSSIPFREGTELYEVTKGVLGQMGFWDDATSESWFQDAKVDGIEVFAMSGFPYQPIVMDSVMEPIARGWLEQSNTQDSREAFWQFKRARLLGEAIPADPKVISSMVRGWYVAKALGRLDVEHRAGRTRPQARGVGCGIPRARRLPAPAAAPAQRPAGRLPGRRDAVAHDRAGAVQRGRDAALRSPPYRALAALGGEQGGAVAGAHQLAAARRRSTAARPVPPADRAGTAEGDLASRQTARARLPHRRAAAIPPRCRRPGRLGLGLRLPGELGDPRRDHRGPRRPHVRRHGDEIRRHGGLTWPTISGPTAKASIVLLPSGEQGEAILALAGEWTKMGLLGHALWVHARAGRAMRRTARPHIRAVVLGVGHDLEVAAIEVDLFEALAREALSVVRLVKLRSAVPSRELDAAQDAITDRVREYVRKSMPHAESDGDRRSTSRRSCAMPR